MAGVEKLISPLAQERLGSLELGAHSSALARPPDDPFWERARAELTWRGEAAIANENIMNIMIAETSMVQTEIAGVIGARR